MAETSGPADAELPRIRPGLVAHADPGVKAPQPPRASLQLGRSWRPGTWPDLYLRALLERACSAPRPIGNRAQSRVGQSQHTPSRPRAWAVPGTAQWAELVPAGCCQAWDAKADGGISSGSGVQVTWDACPRG